MEHKTYELKTWEIGIYTEGSYLWTSLRMKDYISIVYPNVYKDNENVSFRANGITAESGLFTQHYFMKNLRLKMNLGILLDFSGKLYLKGDKNAILNFRNNVVKPQWTGLRIGFQIDILFR